MTFDKHSARRDRQIVAFVAGVLFAGLAASAALIVVQHTIFFSQSNWAIFGLFAVLLVLARPSRASQCGSATMARSHPVGRSPSR